MKGKTKLIKSITFIETRLKSYIIHLIAVNTYLKKNIRKNVSPIYIVKQTEQKGNGIELCDQLPKLEEVKEVIKLMKNNKSPGHDNLRADFSYINILERYKQYTMHRS